MIKLRQLDAVQGARMKWSEVYYAYGEGHFVKRNAEMGDQIFDGISVLKNRSALVVLIA